MSNIIKLKRGSGSDPSASDLVVGEVALRTDSGKLFTKKDNGNVAEIGGSGISDGDKGDITVSNSGDTFTIDDGVVTSAKIADGTIDTEDLGDLILTNAKVATNAAIAGTKISPNFGSQNIQTSGDLQIIGTYPNIVLMDSDNDSDFRISNANGKLLIYDTTNSATRFTVNSDGHIDVAGNLDVGAGIDVTGNITATGTITSTGLIMADNKSILLGDSDDFRIRHTGSHSEITDEGTGFLRLGGSQKVDIGNANFSKLYFRGSDGGGVGLYHNGTLKFGTSSDGINVYGGITSTGDITISSAAPKIFLTDTNNNDDYEIRNDDGTFTIRNSTDGNDIISVASNNTTTFIGNCDFSSGIDVTGNITGTGDLKINNINKSLQVGDITNDNYADLRQISASSYKGFSFQHSNASVLANLQGTTNQYLVLGDNDNNNSGTLFGISIDQGGSVHTRLTLSASGNLDVQNNITLGGTVDGVDIAARDTLFGGLTSSSGVLTNGVTATTQSAGNNTTRVATTAFVSTAIANLVDSAPGTLNTLNELAAALGDDANFSTTVTNSIATKMPLAGGTFSGDVTFSGGASAISIAANSDIRFTNGTWTGDAVKIQQHANRLYVVGGSAGIRFRESNVDRWDIDPNGHFVPRTDSTYNIGSTSIKVANGYFDNLYGSGANITALNASNISSGTIPAARVPTLNQNTTGSAASLVLGNDSTGSTPRRIVFASADTGTVTIQADTNSGATYTPSTGTISAQIFNGSGSGLSNLNASNLSAGTVPQARLSASTLLTLIKTVDGSSSGLDADTLDGVQASGFVAAGGDTMTGALRIDIDSNVDGIVGEAYNNYFGLKHADQTLNSEYMILSQDSDTFISATSGYKVKIRNGGNDTTNELIVGSGNDALTWRGNKIFHAGNDGSGSGLDSDTLDGIQASSFIRSDATDTVSGATKFSNHGLELSGHWFNKYFNAPNAENFIHLYPASSSDRDTTASTTNIRAWTGSTFKLLQIKGDSNDITWGGSKLWTAANDGSGSGLDSDTLDGIHASSFLRSDANDSASGTLNLNGKVVIGNSLTRPSALDSDADAHCRIGGSDVYLYVASLSAGGGYKLAMQAARASDFASFTLNLQSNGGNLERGGNKVWDAGNDGSGSGLDSDLLDGVQGSSYLRSDADDTMSANLTIDNGTSTLLNVKCDDGGNAIVRAGGDSQGTGAFEVSQNNGTHGGGIAYNGDGSPSFASGETADHITFYRLDNGTRTEVFHYPYNSNTVNFNARPTIGGVDIVKSTDTIAQATNASTLDNIDSGSFARSDASDTLSGDYTFTGGAGAITITSSDIRSAGSSTWTGNPGLDVGKIQMHSNRWYIVANGNSNRIVQFRVNGDDKTWIANDGQIYHGSSGTGDKYWRQGNDGSGSGLDSDTVDGLQASSFLRSDAADVIGGVLSYHNNEARLQFRNTTYNAYLYIGGWTTSNDNNISRIRNSNANLHLDSGANGNLYLNHYSTGTIYARGNTVWHAGNDGSGSGLDSDTVDGIQASSFLRSDAADTGTTLTLTDALRTDRFEDQGGAFFWKEGLTSGRHRHLNLADTNSDPASVTDSHNPTGISWGQRTDNNGYYMLGLKGQYNNGYSNHSRLTLAWHTGIEIGSSATYGGVRFMADTPFLNTTEIMQVNSSGGHVKVKNNLYANNGGLVWNANNDGSGSGLDSDLLDGLQGSSYLRSDQSDEFNGDLTIGNGTGNTRLLIKKQDNNVADHIIFYNGTTRVGEIGVEDTTWLRINQETAKNIYTPRYIRADGGFFVDGNSKGINGSGNFVNGTIAGASDYSTLLRSDTADTASGDITFSGGAGAVSIAAASDIRLASGDWTGDSYGKIQHHNNFLYIGGGTNGIIFRESGTNRWRIDGTGHFVPNNSNTYNIGSPSLRVANLYVNDMHFSNEGKTNDVDGSWGDWTLQEGEEDIFMINNRTGKKFKIAMIPV